ncbi:MAG: response regulator transcription factor [Rhodothermales bacterium]|nr:response regulator transcription factor [Rhodothermales bacterium]
MIRVALAEDHTPLRVRLADFLSRSGTVRLVAVAANGHELLDALKRLPEAERPQVVVMDLEMPRLDGIATTATLRELYPSVEVLVFTVFEDDTRLFAAIEAGAAGYLLKDQPLTDVLDAVEDVHAGGSPLSAPMARRLLDTLRPPHPEANPFDLTDREIEVLRLVVAGHTNTEMADALGIAFATVKTHVRHIYEKLHVSTRAEATRTAIRRGLV